MTVNMLLLFVAYAKGVENQQKKIFFNVTKEMNPFLGDKY